MNVPTVNVVMTYNPEKMMKFQETKSLTAFKELGDKDVQVFSNSPNSNFISLIHEFNYGGGEGDYPRVELEFIDPKGLFDHNLDFGSHTLFDPKDDLVAQLLLSKKFELMPLEGKYNFYKSKNQTEGSSTKKETAAMTFSEEPLASKYWEEPVTNWTKNGFAELLQNKADLGWVKEKINTLKDEVEKLESYKAGEDPMTKLGLIQKQINAYNATLGQPVWITYGIGDDLRNWCPPLCFNQVTMVEFSFDATRGRTMKLIYGGEGEKHPNLTSMGIVPLGSLGIGAVFNGSSRRIFSKEADDELLSAYAGHLEARDELGPFRPSIHKIITDTLKDFLQTSTNDNNVMVLFPNLDQVLGYYYKQEYESVKSSNADKFYTNDAERLLGDQVWHVETTREVLEGLGFTMSCSRNSYKGRMGDSIFNALERQADGEDGGSAPITNLGGGMAALTPVGYGSASPDSVIAWLEDRDFRCELSTNGLAETVKDRLKSVGEKLEDKVVTTNKESKPFNVGWYYETDFNVLQVLESHGLIKDKYKPALIFGEMNIILNVIGGRFFEYPNVDEDALRTQLKVDLKDMDIKDGYSYDLMLELYEIEMPVPWVSPFGPTNDYTKFTPEDMNVKRENSSASWALNEAIQQWQTGKRLPIFSFGTRNPNILNFDMDINKQYTKLLGTFNYANISSFTATTAILGTNINAAQEACNLLSQVVTFQTFKFKGKKDKNGVPDAFRTLIEPYWDKDPWGGGGSLMNFEDWEEVFSILAPELNIEDDFQSFDNFALFLWGAFCSLTQGDVPRAKLRQRGVNSIKEMLNRHTFLANRLSMEGYLGTIKTVPMFHLSNVRRAVKREALVLGIEPKFTGTDTLNAWVPESTWFTGLYLLNGFKHTITKGGVFSEFAVNKPLSTGGFIGDK